jgi:ketosteroid isomerase-like protein
MWLILSALSVLLAPTPAAPGGEPGLVGTWHFVREIDRRTDGAPIDPPVEYDGLLIYTADGFVSAQIFPRGRGWVPDSASLKELRSGFELSTSYFGRYAVDPAAKTVTHHVESGLDPDDAGEKTRRYRLSGDELVLTGSWVYGGETVQFEITWRREPGSARAARADDSDFRKLMETLAEGWNRGDAAKAADCFTADAVYVEPPDKQVYRGRAALYEMFGGAKGRKETMKMTWHHLVFDSERQIGAGEFTFEYGGPVHGVAVVRLRDGKISNWREYWYESKLAWDEFTRNNPF